MKKYAYIFTGEKLRNALKCPNIDVVPLIRDTSSKKYVGNRFLQKYCD